MESLRQRLLERAKRAYWVSQLKFETEGLDRTSFERTMARPEPVLDYVIYFTPRSGSSRITDIAKRSGVLSQPGECFHPVNVPIMARKLGAGSLAEYVEVIRRIRNTKGVFGCEVTFGMIERTFGGPEAFLEQFGGSPCFWLIREDIVAQAVSMMKLKQTKIGHTAHSAPEERRAAEDRFTYDGREIRRWIEHAHKLERRTENMFETFNLAPLRISYEMMTALPDAGVANVLAAHLALPLTENTEIASDHVKLGTDKNSAFAARFIEENASFFEDMCAKRAEMLSRLDRAFASKIG